MTEKQGLRLIALNHELWKIAEPVGSLHGYWDIIFDIKAFLEGRPPLLQMTAEEWIAYAEELLQDKKKD